MNNAKVDTMNENSKICAWVSYRQESQNKHLHFRHLQTIKYKNIDIIYQCFHNHWSRLSLEEEISSAA